MSENLKYFGKLAFIGVFTWLKIYLLNFLSSFLCLLIGLGMILQNIAEVDKGNSLGSGGAHTSGPGNILFVLEFFSMRPWQFILLSISVILVTVAIGVGSRYVFRKMGSRILREKMDSLILPSLDKIIATVKGSMPSKVNSLGEMAHLKLKMMQTARTQSQNKWVRKALVYGFKKVRLEDVDFHQENFDVYDEIRTRTLVKLKSLETPANRNYIWLLIGLQWSCILLIFITLKYQY